MAVVIPQVVTEDRASGAQVIDGSLRFDDDKGHCLSRTPGSAGNRKTWTWSGWVKRSSLGTRDEIFTVWNSDTDSQVWSLHFFETDNTLRVTQISYTARITSQVFRDTSAWYHIVMAVDTTQSTANDRIKLYVNGTQITAFSTTANPTQNSDTGINGTYAHQIGRYFRNSTATGNFDGHLNNVYLIDGQALGPGYFGYTDPLTNTWRPKKFKPQATPNNGTTWSSNLTASYTNCSQSGSISNMFDGNLSTIGLVAGSNTHSVTYTLASGKSYSSSVRIYAAGASAGLGQRYVLLNGNRTNHDSTGWITVATGSGTINSFGTGADNTNDSWISAIEVDGVILLDNDTSNMGLNGFYLPMDGNSPIGQDKSGNGNDWTPVNFGGSAALDKATGALPILSTVSGGKVATTGVRTDPYASSLVLAIPGAGNLNDVHADIKGSGTNKTVTNAGSIAFSGTTNNFYSNSIYSAGSTNQYFTVGSSTESDFDMTGDFTIEFWHYPVTSGYAMHARAFYFGTSDVNSGGQFVFYSNDIDISSATDGLFNGTPFYGIVNHKFDQWNHHAITREGNTLRYFQNGVLLEENTQTTPTGIASGKRTLYIGGSSYMTPQYWQDFRIYNGVAKYTSNFIPASTNPDILPDTPSGVSGSSKLTKVTDGAVSFDGSGDYLTSTSSDYAFGTGDCTVEGWAYIISHVNYRTLATTRPDHFGYADAWHVAVDGNGSMALYSNAFNLQSANNAVPAGTWFHWAFTRSSGTARLFVNGTVVASGSVTNNYTRTILGIGNFPVSTAEYMYGYISNFHVVKGTALYTSDFTPPTAPLTSVANTKLLCCKSPTSATAFDVSPGTITANGNAAATNFNPFTTDINTVRGQESGYCTWNPLDKNTNLTVQNGNLKLINGGTNSEAIRGTIGVNSGKWYWEVTVETSMSGTTAITFGIGAQLSSLTSYLGSNAYGYGWYNDGGGGTAAVHNASFPTYGTRVELNTVVGVAFNADERTLVFYRDGVSQGVAHSGITTATYMPMVSVYNVNCSTNFGQKPFKFPPPDGFQPLNAANVRPSAVIARPDKYFGVTTYTSTASSLDLNIGFKPDLVWFSRRNATGYIKFVQDSVRGINKVLATSHTQGTQAENGLTGGGDYTQAITSLNSNGVTIGTNAQVNEGSGGTYVAWSWKAGHPNTPTNGAVYFDNTGDYLSLSQSDDFSFGTGAFTCEAYCYFNTLAADDCILEFRGNGGSGDGWVWFINGSAMQVYDNGLITASTTTLGTKRWYHLAISRTSGGTLYYFVDGVAAGTATWTTATANTNGLRIGTRQDTTNSFDGHMSNVRVVKGTALYTSAFTPPTSPLTNVTNTKLLCCQSSTSAGAAAVSPNVSGVNDGRAWSTLTSGGAVLASYPMTQTFDGSTSTAGVRAVSGGGFIFGGSLGISYSSSIRIHSGISGVGTQKFKLNDGSETDFPENTWVTVVSGSGTLNKIEITAGTTGNANIYLGAVEIDGTILVDPVTANGNAAATTYNPFDAFSVNGTGYSTASAAGLTAGTITPTGASVNTKSGFSIISYTGTGSAASIPHGLETAPSMLIVKSRTTAGESWITYHSGAGLKFGALNLPNAFDSNVGTIWNSTAPSSNVFSIGTNTAVNGSTTSYVAYLWADVPGLQKFGSYTGNGSPDGPFVELGFRPRWLLIKNTSTAVDWELVDTARDPSNGPQNNRLQPNTNVAEAAGYVVFDILSNGFKVRGSTGNWNGNTNTIIYAAFAEAPSFNLYGAQANAR